MIQEYQPYSGNEWKNLSPLKEELFSYIYHVWNQEARCSSCKLSVDLKEALFIANFFLLLQTSKTFFSTELPYVILQQDTFDILTICGSVNCKRRSLELYAQLNDSFKERYPNSEKHFDMCDFCQGMTEHTGPQGDDRFSK